MTDNDDARRKLRVKLATVELLRYMVNAHREGERAVYLVVRLALDDGVPPAEVADVLRLSTATMYRRLREHDLSHGRGRLPHPQ